MKPGKAIDRDDNTHIPEEYDEARTAALHAFYSALKGNDSFEAAKAIGVLEFLGQTDVDYFAGMMYRQMALELTQGSMDALHIATEPRVKEYLDKAIAYFLKVPENSEFHAECTAHVEAAYRACGRYEDLDALLTRCGSSLSPVEEMSKRIDCLESLVVINPDDEAAFPMQIATRPIERIGESTDQQLAKFQVFSSFARALTMAVDCVAQCAEYAKNVPDCDAKFAQYEETAPFASLYEKSVRVLRCSRLLSDKLLPEAIGDLLHLALAARNWDQRISMYGNEQWYKSLAQTCWQLCSPETHPQVDPFQCVEGILQNYICLGQLDFSPVISRYFATIAEAAKRGNQSAQIYLGFTYNMIKTNGDDPYDLKKKLTPFAHDLDGDVGDLVLQHARLSTALSQQSFDALVNAEFALVLHETAHLETRDASHIALMFFRVLEFEYSDSLVHPLIAAIDFDKLEQTTGYVEHSKRQRDNDHVIERRYERWLKGLDALYTVKTGYKKAMEIGVLRTFLTNILHRNDPCADILEEALESVLTEAGIEAYRSEKLMDVIGKTQVDEYRNPGAHTGFVTFTKAKEARDYITAWAPIVATWFKASENRG